MMNNNYRHADTSVWSRGDRYYHDCSAFDDMEDPCEEMGGNLQWDLCTDCIKLPDLYDRLDFQHHKQWKYSEGSHIDGPTCRPEYYWRKDHRTGRAEASGEYVCDVCEIVLNH
jgi:hypothetical protein